MDEFDDDFAETDLADDAADEGSDGGGKFDLSRLGDPETIARKLIFAFVTQIGGLEVLRWMQKHYDERHSYEEIGQWAGVSSSTVRYRVKRGSEVMREHDIFPAEWAALDEQMKVAKTRTGDRD
jgi:hypothetical protein